MSTKWGIYIQHVGKSGWHVGLELLICGLKLTAMWAEQNRAAILLKQRLCLGETEPAFHINRASVSSGYSIRKGTEIIHFCIQVRFQPKPSMKRGFFKELKAESVFFIFIIQ